jgi:chorismate mutase/prephenate dehydratase
MSDSENSEKLAEYRVQIDSIDQQLLGLLNERARLALQVGIAKGGTSVYRPEREAEVLANVTGANKGPLADEAVHAIFKKIIEVCRTIQLTK